MGKRMGKEHSRKNKTQIQHNNRVEHERMEKKMNDFMETWGKDKKVMTVRNDRHRIKIPKE